MIAYLQFKAGPAGPFQTIEVPARHSPRPRKGRTVSGYGRAIPTDLEVLWSGRWHRVKVAQWGNAGAAYIGAPGKWIATVTA